MNNVSALGHFSKCFITSRTLMSVILELPHTERNEAAASGAAQEVDANATCILAHWHILFNFCLDFLFTEWAINSGGRARMLKIFELLILCLGMFILRWFDHWHRHHWLLDYRVVLLLHHHILLLHSCHLSHLLLLLHLHLLLILHFWFF